MKHTIIEKAALKAKSEETGIPFSNLLAGYVLEELMYLIEDSPFSLFLWLKNSGALGVEQYRKKNLLTLDFAYVTDPRAMKREGIVPGQELSLKMGYVMLAYILKVEKVPDISWKGRASAGDHRVDLEIAGEFEEMTVPIHIRVTELTEEGLVPVKRTFMPFMEGGKQIPYLEYPVESILAENLFYLIRDMELLPDMSVYDKVYGILKTEPVDGRHIQELLGEHCKKQQLLPEESRMKEILSYRDYSYMRKRWEKYLRHRKRKEPAWTEVMQVLEQFLPQMWSTLCRDEIFFGDWMPDLQQKAAHQTNRRKLEKGNAESAGIEPRFRRFLRSGFPNTDVYSSSSWAAAPGVTAIPFTSTPPSMAMTRHWRPSISRVSIRSVWSGLTLMITSGVLTSKARVLAILLA